MAAMMFRDSATTTSSIGLFAFQDEQHTRELADHPECSVRLLTVTRVIRRQDIPDSLLAIASAHPCENMVHHRRWCDDCYIASKTMADYEQTPAEVLNQLFLKYSAQGIAALSDLPVSGDTEFTSHVAAEHVRAAVAAHPHASSCLLQQIPENDSQRVLSAAIQNPNMPTGRLRELAGSIDDEDILPLIADHHNTPAETLSRLAHHSHANVRFSVARNPSTAAEVLSMLASEPHDGIRVAVASNPTTAADTLTQLASDSEGTVRLAVAKHAATVTEIAMLLMMDSNDAVRKSAACAISARKAGDG